MIEHRSSLSQPDFKATFRLYILAAAAMLPWALLYGILEATGVAVFLITLVIVIGGLVSGLIVWRRAEDALARRKDGGSGEVVVLDATCRSSPEVRIEGRGVVQKRRREHAKTLHKEEDPADSSPTLVYAPR